MKSDTNGKGIFAEVVAAMSPKQKRYAFVGMMALAGLYYLLMAVFILIGFGCAVSLLLNPADPGATGRGLAGLLFLVLFAIMQRSLRKEPTVN